MRRTELLQEIRKMRFEEVYFGWSEIRLTQVEAELILGVCDGCQCGYDFSSAWIDMFCFLKSVICMSQ